MNKKAPKLKLIQGGKKSSPKIKLNMELFLVCLFVFSVLICLYGV